MVNSNVFVRIGAFILPVIVGLLVFILFYTVNQFTSTPKKPFTYISAVVPTASPLTKQPPTRIIIPKIHKDLPVQASVVDGNSWELFDTSVAWLATSAVPGEGNVILYAHNWPSLWSDLYKLTPGDRIEVEQYNTRIVYEVFESRSVNPGDVDAILSDQDQLTLYTCEGSFDQKRRVVYAMRR